MLEVMWRAAITARPDERAIHYPALGLDERALGIPAAPADMRPAVRICPLCSDELQPASGSPAHSP